MIKLAKLGKPSILEANAGIWTQVLLDRVAANVKASDAEKSRYRHPDIKSVLVEETGGKCAYCESKLLHVTYGDVEHIIPKSTDPGVTFEWDNLTLACDVCNTNKGDRFSGGIGFIDPYVHDPANHFNVVGALIFAKAGDNDARVTEETLKLNRAELIERRGQKIQNLRNEVEVIRRAPSALQSILIESLKEEIKVDKEYAAIARACLPLLLA